jgi:transcriptional regulator with XRE-family HTH domain
MKRHSAEEISSKLREAEALMAHGLSQAQACKKLGVSVMTFHRWRKLDLSGSYVPPSTRMAGSESIELREAAEDEMGSDRIAELRLENERLRRIVTDLLLEKMRIEEEFLRRDRVK